MGDCDVAQFSQLSYFGGQNSFSNHPQPTFSDRQCSSAQSDFDFQKSRIHPSVNRSKLSIPFKSEMCLQFQRGKCFYGENCHFSHSVTDIRKPALNLNPVGIKMMKECHWFSSGVDCPYGERCQFLHKCDYKIRNGKDQIERRMDVVENIDRMASRKTKLCSKWERFGSCPYGRKCIFAHGKAELKDVSSPAVVDYAYTFRLQPASQPKSLAIPETGTLTLKNLQLKRKRCFRNWEVKKICQIYADWIDDKQNASMSCWAN